MSVIDSVFQILEGSYIPLFMRAVPKKQDEVEEARNTRVLQRGSVVSVMGLFLGNCGGLTALLIGIIISYGRGGPMEDGYHNFLLAITIAAVSYTHLDVYKRQVLYFPLLIFPSQFLPFHSTFRFLVLILVWIKKKSTTTT